MTIKIASWNIEGRLSIPDSKKRGSSRQIISAIKKLNADILLLLEAHTEDSIKDLDSYKQLVNIGYKIYDIPYEDDMALRKDTYASKLSIILLSKLPVEKIDIIRLGNIRNAISLIINQKNNKSFRVIGVHLDDRFEKTRIKQTMDLSKIINKLKIPTIVMGDFNAMHDDLLPAKFLQTKLVKMISRFIFSKIAIKVVDMARGDTLKLLISKTNLTDIDSLHRPTTTPKMRGMEWMPSIRLIQIDHIFTSPEITAKNFKIAPDKGSDHRAISAEIEINSTL